MADVVDGPHKAVHFQSSPRVDIFGSAADDMGAVADGPMELTPWHQMADEPSSLPLGMPG
jgi:hypothetical protein